MNDECGHYLDEALLGWLETKITNGYTLARGNRKGKGGLQTIRVVKDL
jgi:hypothetical protein